MSMNPLYRANDPDYQRYRQECEKAMKVKPHVSYGKGFWRCRLGRGPFCYGINPVAAYRYWAACFEIDQKVMSSAVEFHIRRI